MVICISKLVGTISVMLKEFFLCFPRQRNATVEWWVRGGGGADGLCEDSISSIPFSAPGECTVKLETPLGF